jgi:hypothetical protein
LVSLHHSKARLKAFSNTSSLLHVAGFALVSLHHSKAID